MHVSQKFICAAALLAITFSTATTLRADEKEPALIAVLQSDKPAADKAITCKLLAIHGSKAAVPDLAKLLSDPQLASWARIALEAIPGPEVDEALRKASATLEGNLLIGTLNSIGVRRDAAAVEVLSGRLADKDGEVAAAAAVALGRIGTADAAKVLRKSLMTAAVPVRSAVAEGCVLCAERMLADGKADEAVAIYDEIRKADVPKPRLIEATRGAIIARKDAGIPLLIEQLQSEDKGFFLLGLTTARELSGAEVDKALAKEIATASPKRAALIVAAIADRKSTVALPALVAAADNKDKEVRIAAITALARVGDDSCLAVVLKAAQETDADLAKAAKATLADLQGEKVNAQIVSLLATSEGKTYAMLIDLVGQRRIDAVPQLLKALNHADKQVRSTALTALGETVTIKELPVLVTQATATKNTEEDAAAALKALKAASVRMPDREACALVLATAIDKAPVTTQVKLLEIVTEVGGAKALQTVGAAAKSKSPELQDKGSELLGKWNGVDAAPVLLDLAKTAPAEKYQVRALRGYISLARRFMMTDEERAAMCQKALDLSTKAAEKKLVIDVLKLHPGTETLKLAIKLRQTAELKDDATNATISIAQKLGSKGADVSQLLAKAGFDKVKLEIVKAEYGSGSTQRDVTAILQKQANDLPIVTLPAAGYNASFGGDPVPSSVKQLKIQYRIDGKAGEATFAEDALIILPTPMPK